jgi:hypothetical protein
MTPLEWHNLLKTARVAWFRGSAWCALNLLTLARVGGVLGGLWSVSRLLF